MATTGSAMGKRIGELANNDFRTSDEIADWVKKVIGIQRALKDELEWGRGMMESALSNTPTANGERSGGAARAVARKVGRAKEAQVLAAKLVRASLAVFDAKFMGGNYAVPPHGGGVWLNRHSVNPQPNTNNKDPLVNSTP